MLKTGEIYDIYELTNIAIWPIAPIYYFIISLIILLCSCIFYLKHHSKTQARTNWQKAAQAELNEYILDKYINLPELHNTIKKILIQKTSRQNVARLSGRELLNQLEEHDPYDYPWNIHAEFFSKIFAKNNNYKKDQEVSEILNALKKWL